MDGGFGSGSLTAPLPIDDEAEQLTPHEPRRVIQRNRVHVQQSRLGDNWADLYEFTLQPVQPVDYVVANWFTSTFPQSRFVLHLIAAIAGDGVRYTLLNREFATRWIDGRVEKRELTTQAELLEVLATYFSLSFPASTRFGAVGAPWPR